MAKPTIPTHGSARRVTRLLRMASVLATIALVHSPLIWTVYAQERVPREVRTYIPPDQIASFQPTTSFARFVELLNPIFQTVTSKLIVDPEQRRFPIGITVAGLHFFDAFELVLEYNNLTYRETDSFFIIEVPPAETELLAPQPGTLRPGAAAARAEVLATHETREVQINALIFQLDHTRTRQLGIDWNILFPPVGGQQQGQQGQRQEDDRIPRLRVRADRFLDRFDDYLVTPDQVDLAFLTNLLRVLESVGAGETLAQPSVTVQSGEEGRIQIGSDIPVTVRDFAGNTITQFVSTGIIVHVVPTLIESPLADTAGAPTLDFIHLNVQVENSNGRPFGDAVAIDRSTANTQVLLIDGEQTIIGGLYSVSAETENRGIPILKDLPPWVFGLRYIFGFERKTYTQQELLIVLKAQLLDPLGNRVIQPLRTEQLEEFRNRVDRMLESVDRNLLERLGGESATSRVER